MSKQARKPLLLFVALTLLVLGMSAESCGTSSTSGGNTSGVAAPKCVEQSTNTTVVNTQSNFKSNFVGLPITPGFVDHGVFSNIYVWPDPATESWDKHLASLSTSAVPSETSETLDRLTCDLVNSSYFDPLTQYGIAPPVFAGDETTVSSCVSAMMRNADAHNGVIQYLAIKDFVNCENDNASGPKTTQVNLFFSPELTVANANILNPKPLSCPTENAYHGWWFGTRNFTVIPTSKACSSDISRLTHALSHEMVETLSDPAAMGWIHDSGTGRVGPGVDLEQEYNEGELGDICSPVGAHTTPNAAFVDLNIQAAPLSVAPYWSNADNACVPPAIMNVTLWTGTGTTTFDDGKIGLARLKGGSDPGVDHTLGEIVIFPPSLANKQVLALEILITTGGDALDGGSSKNADVVLNLASGDVSTPDINEDSEWAENSLHTAFLTFPQGMSVDNFSAIKGSKGFTIETNFPGGLSGENWDILSVTLEAAVSV